MMLPDIDHAKNLAADILQQFSVPGAGIAIVANHGAESASWGYGVCELGSSEPVTADTTFQLASCSKAYTAATSAILVDRGELNWDDPVRRHLPEFQMHDERLSQEATLRDLLSMRLGYRNEGIVNWGRNTELGVDIIFDRLRYLPLAAGFRETFTYLNPAYTLIAEVIARRTGKLFAEFQRDALHLPLGQHHTFVCEGKYLPKQSHAFPHVALENGIEPLREARCGGRMGESCVYSTAHDAARWISFQLAKGVSEGQRIVSQASMDEMHRPHVFGPPVPALNNSALGYGMGWQWREMPDGPVSLHEGGEFGVSTFTMLDMRKGLGACVYANLPTGAGVKAATYTLLDLMAGRVPGEWAKIFVDLSAQEQDRMRSNVAKGLAPESQQPLSELELVGSYFDPANGVLDIIHTAAGLEMKVRDGWIYDGRLQPEGQNTFREHCYYKGTRAMARMLNSKLQFVRAGTRICLRAPGFGTFYKLDVPAS